MARIRTIKPEFFTSEDIVALPALARILYVGLWCEADKEGRLSWKPNTFKMRYLPADDCNIDELCSAIIDRGLIQLYGEGLAFIPSFKDHQHINPREKESVLPEPLTRAPRVPHASVTDETRDSDAQVGKEGKERKGTRVNNAFDAAEIELPDLINKTFWVQWCEFRKSKNKKISEHAAKLQIEMLAKHDQKTQAQIITKSIQSDYQGLFEPDGGQVQKPEQQRRRLQPL